MKIIKIQGVVIKETNTGESDKIITIFTKKLGRIQAAAKGARRPQSRLIAGTQFLCFSNFILFKGKDIYSIRNCDLIESFYNVRNSLERITYASHIVDLVAEVSRENLSNIKLMQLFLNTLHMLSYSDKYPALISRIFEIRLMSIVGFTPELVECLGCRCVTGEDIFFSPVLGGVTCRDCSLQDRKTVKISDGTLSALRFIVFNDIKKIFSFTVSEKVMQELKAVSERFIAAHLEKNFSKLNFLDLMGIGEQKNE